MAQKPAHPAAGPATGDSDRSRSRDGCALKVLIANEHHGNRNFMNKIRVHNAGPVPVLHLPGESHPGVLLRGDVLYNLYRTAKEVYSLVNLYDHPEAYYLARDLLAILGPCVRTYDAVLAELHLEPPGGKS